MVNIIELETDRLILRQWKASDYAVFAELNANMDVMKYYPNVLSSEESNALADKISSRIVMQGWGFWAVEIKENRTFIGFVGLNRPEYKLPVVSCVEIGWRLSKNYWGKGYATEAAKTCLKFAFEELKLSEVYSFASVVNKRSRAVMVRLNMVDTHNNFSHPLADDQSILSEHVLMKIDRQRWTV